MPNRLVYGIIRTVQVCVAALIIIMDIASDQISYGFQPGSTAVGHILSTHTILAMIVTLYCTVFVCVPVSKKWRIAGMTLDISFATAFVITSSIKAYALTQLTMDCVLNGQKWSPKRGYCRSYYGSVAAGKWSLSFSWGDFVGYALFMSLVVSFVLTLRDYRAAGKVTTASAIWSGWPAVCFNIYLVFNYKFLRKETVLKFNVQYIATIGIYPGLRTLIKRQTAPSQAIVRV